MKFTSEDLMKTMGLKVGDRVAFKYGVDKVIFKINENELEYENGKLPLFNLLNRDIEILPTPKRVGDLKCDSKCYLCPCIYVCNDEINAIDKTLYEVLELGIATFTKTPKKMNEEIHSVIKSQLDKEVEEE